MAPHLRQIHKQQKVTRISPKKGLQEKLLYLAAAIELIVACACGLSFPRGTSGFLVT